MYFEVNDTEPIYLQIIGFFKTSIVVGRLNAGDEVPSRREYAEILKVNPNTVQRAYREMEGEGIIETVRNFPSKITYDVNILDSIKKELVTDAVEKFSKSMRDLNFSKEEVLNLIKETY